MPTMHASGDATIVAKHPELGKFNLYCIPSPPPVGPDGESVGDPDDSVDANLLFTENNTNFARLYGGQNPSPYVKDSFHDHIIPSHRPANSKSTSFVNPEKKGTKSAAQYVFHDVPARGGCAVVRLKLTPRTPKEDLSIEDEAIFDDNLEERRQEADEFYNRLVLGSISDDFRQIMRQAFGGMLWTKQYYQFIQKDWSQGDPAQPPPPPNRKYIRNKVSTCTFVRRDRELTLVIGLEASLYRRYSFNARQVSRNNGACFSLVFILMR